MQNPFVKGDTMISLVWFRYDLRIEDNVALTQAIKESDQILCVYIFDTTTSYQWMPGEAQQWWIKKSLSVLENNLKKRGASLTIKYGNPETILKTLVKDIGAKKIYWNTVYEPSLMARDKKIKLAFEKDNVDVIESEGYLLTDPEMLKNKSGGNYKVYTPYWRECRRIIHLRALYTVPKKINAIKLQSEKIKIDNKVDYSEYWQPGEEGAHEKLREFLSEGLNDYSTLRDIPSAYATSRLSPHLHFGEISPMQVWSSIEDYSASHKINQNSVDTFLSQLGWREFSYYLLYHFPNLPSQNLRPEFDNFKWEYDKTLLNKWQKGQTGYPIIDAGMRELLATGTMHNRVRMLSASFLIKDLLIHWTEGEAWFWDHLLDADLANNAASWQWVAGSGSDAAPYFRIFNPILQANKFDPHGEYIKKWIPELKNVPVEYIADPSSAPDKILQHAGVVLGKNYPKRIIEHGFARKRALDNYKLIR